MSKNRYFAYRSFWPELGTTKQFYERGIGTVCFIAGNTVNSIGEPYCKYPAKWLWHGKYDFSPLAKQVNDILSVAPDARLICKIDLNTPMWYVRNGGGKIDDTFYGLGKMVCCEKWRSDTAAYMDAFLTFAEEHFGDHLDAYVLGVGSCGEWQDRSQGQESAWREEGYIQWCRKKGLPEASCIPPKPVRDHAEHGILRDPEKDAEGLKYWKFCHEQIVDAIDFFLKRARQSISDSRELGVFHGYILELAYNRLISECYLDYERLLTIPELDFVVVIGTYEDRQIGGGSGFMIPPETVRQSGKAIMQECDQPTHSSNATLSEHVKYPFARWPDEPSTIAGVKREMALCLTYKSSMWWFDMWGDFYKGKKVLETFRRMKEIWDAEIDVPAENNAQIMLVVDPESCFYFNEKDIGLNDFILGTRNRLSQIGAPFDICSFNDIPGIQNPDRIRLYIFTAPFVMNRGKMEMLELHVFGRKCDTLWFYGPGIVNENRWDERNVKRMCGTEFATPGINICRKGDCNSTYVHNPSILTKEILREIAEKAGVHMYTSMNHPVYVNSRLLAVHTAHAEKLEISLPSKHAAVTELYRNKTFQDTDSVAIATSGPDTLLFLLEN